MITKIPQQMLKPHGLYNQNEVVVRDYKLASSQASEIEQTEIVSGRFDANSGVLTLVMFDGTQTVIEGFPVESKIPAGPTGPAGFNGENGLPGNKGRNGKVGLAGCEGPRGLAGITGPRGDEGRTGQVGPVGPEGPAGNIGMQGLPGITGPRGHTGPKGRTGDKGPRGLIGPPGEEQFMDIVVSETEPEEKRHGMLWVNPTADYECGFEEFAQE